MFNNNILLQIIEFKTLTIDYVNCYVKNKQTLKLKL